MIATQDYGWSQLAERAGLGWPDATEWAMAQASEAGLSAWEPLLHGPEDAGRVADLADRHGLAMRSVFVTGNLHDPEEATRAMQRMVATARAAAAKGCLMASVYPAPIGSDQGGDKSDAQLAVQADRLQALAEAFRTEGVQLLYHPEEQEMRHAAREVHHMLLATDPELVGLCLDPDTIWRGAGGSMIALLDVIRLHGDRVREVHVRQSQSGVWSEDIGTGDIDYRAVSLALAAKGARPLLVLELAREPGTPSELDPVEAHRRSLLYVKAVFDDVLTG